ncbi:DUF4397 domain-containing protein [Bacillus luteolus]|uniref:DUF4397 domain-containing protein n=1 Tax=Litchfieldia luteola TaxID=682179 RepID=A0ABR9QPT9_9BACI|nr:DUF4397 domain-containing protein [Cytobacillus luteolus]MBE4910517.1 DUF4397 domain-containing protein [Cytobacillus luteolus]MBP1943694.1 hypothetical protein [Cytobacillus luteolus]
MNHHYQYTDQLVQKSLKYELLANYYKYIDPARHIHYYQKHFQCVQRLMTMGYRADMQQLMNMMESTPRMANIRVLHASPNAPAVDVYANGQQILKNVSYKQVSDYLSVPSGEYVIDIVPTGKPAQRVLRQRVMIQPGATITVAAAGTVENLQLIPVTDKTSSSPGKASVRFFHLSPDAPAVDIAVEDGPVLFRNVSFGNAANYIEIDPAQVNLEVRLAGTDTVVLTIPNVNIQPNKAYTAVAVGLAEGTPSLEAIFLMP